MENYHQSSRYSSGSPNEEVSPAWPRLTLHRTFTSVQIRIHLGESIIAPEQTQPPAHSGGQADEDGAPGMRGHQAAIPGEKPLKRTDNAIAAPTNCQTRFLINSKYLPIFLWCNKPNICRVERSCSSFLASIKNNWAKGLLDSNPYLLYVAVFWIFVTLLSRLLSIALQLVFCIPLNSHFCNIQMKIIPNH